MADARESPSRRRILFLCTGNCCRSPLAEAILRHLAGDRFESLSAGSHPTGFVHELSLLVLAEAGIETRGLESKSILEYLPPAGVPPDAIVALCEHAAAFCPSFPGSVARLQWPVYDPYLARGPFEERLQVFRKVRDALRRRLEVALSTGELGLGDT